MINPAKLFQIKNMWDRFTKNHPKFPKFLQAAAQASIGEGTVLEVKIIKPDGDSIASNIKLTADHQYGKGKLTVFSCESKIRVLK